MNAGRVGHSPGEIRSRGKMFMHSLTRFAFFLALLVAGTLVSLFPAGINRAAAESAAAQFARSADAAGQQRLLGQMLASDVLLVHLGIDKPAAVERVRANLTRFSRLLNGLLYGDPKLGLIATKSEQIITPLQTVNEAWPLFSTAVKNALAARSLSPDLLDSIAGLSEALYEATSKVRAAYNAATNKRLHSQLDIAIETAEDEVGLTQKMIKEYLLVAANHKLRKSRTLLQASFTRFDQALNGLINGDTKRNLLSVPDQGVQDQLKKVAAVWSQCLPLLKPVAADKTPAGREIIVAVNLNRQLMGAMTAAVLAYRKL